jgi:RNA polymerase sigma-70 factor (ECF subfamily)
MTTAGNQTQEIQNWLDRLRAGDEAARKELINCACHRLERLTRKMLRHWERVHRWEETGDVLQNASLRLYRSLSEVKPASVMDFFRLAALNIRRELYDLSKHYYGPRGIGANHATACLAPAATGSVGGYLAWAPEGNEEDPSNLAAWAEFHAQVEHLPEEVRTVFDLLWYQELSQAEAARLLGISERTLKRRWASARLCLHDILGRSLPGCAADQEPTHTTAPASPTSSLS